MNWLPLYYQLFRFLFCPSRFLFYIVCTAFVSMIGGQLMVGLGFDAGLMMSMLGAGVLAMVLGFMLSAQLPLLISRKTLVFNGAISIHMGVLICAVLAVIALLITAVAQFPPSNTPEYYRWVLFCFSGLLLATAISALVPLGLVIISFTFMLLANVDPVFEALASWPAANHPGLYILAAASVSGAGVFLYRLYKGRLALTPGIYSGNFNRQRPDASVATMLSKFAFRTLYNRKLTTASVLLFEPRNWPLLMLVSMTSFALFAFFIDAPLIMLLALSIFLLPAVHMLIALTTVPVNMRRLWLTVAGDRARQFRYMERQLLKRITLFLLPGFAVAMVLLWLSGKGQLWLGSYSFVVVMLVANYAYFVMLTANASYYAQAFSTSLFWAGGCIGLFFWRPATLVTVAGVLVMALLVIRYLAYRYWLDVDLSRLRKPHSSWSQ